MLDLQLNGKKLDIAFPIVLKNKDGKVVYYENSNGYWTKREYLDGRVVYYENSNGYWVKRESLDGVEVYYEDSNGHIEDNRPKPTKELTIQQIEEQLDYKIKVIK